MSKRRKKSGAKLLTILWLLTAASALIVTVVYFGKIEALYSALGTIESQANSTQKSQNGKEQEHKNKQEEIPADNTDLAVTLTPVSEVADNTDLNDDSKGSAGEEQQPEATGTPIEFDPSEHPYYFDPYLDPSKPIIALSFDDGPSPYTERILEALDTYGAKATFFMVGYQIESFSENVKKVYDAGCQIGNHTSDHKDLSKLTAEQIKKQIYPNEELINSYAPVGEIIVRPPYGNYNDTVRAAVERPMFNWSIDSLDWKSRNADSIVAEVKAHAQDGYIILCHDLYESTAEAVERFLPWLIEEGYQVTCISNMYEARGEKTLAGHVYRYTAPAPDL